MPANKYTILQNGILDKSLTIPIQMDWNLVGQEMSIDLYQEDVVKKVIGKPYDFEVDRFSHEQYDGGKTNINYQFYFYSEGSLSNPVNWNMDYISAGFTTKEVYYYANSFSNSFFKLDFYDTQDEKRQTNYITIILPTQQGGLMNTFVGRTEVNIKKPDFYLDFVGDVEGFFVYWLKSRDFLDIKTFYMTAKFYDAKNSGFVKMMNAPQSSIIGNKYYFDNLRYFYYKVELDYINQTYQVLDPNGNRVGITNKPIVWYEYVNPPQ